MMINKSLTPWVCILFGSYGAWAWMDEGHMLIAAIAENILQSPPVDANWTASEGRGVVSGLNKILSHWDEDYPEYGDMISAATWMDNIKCGDDCCRSRSTGKFDALKMFNHLHFVDIPVDELDPDVSGYFRAPDNALWLLNNILSSLKIGGLGSNATIANNKSGNPNRGSVFSLNLMLRMFLHVLGDIHQPLHTAVYYDEECFDDGDQGGNLIYIRVKDNAETLHYYWDTCALTKKTPRGKLSLDYVRSTAQKLIDEYGPFNPSMSLNDIAVESHQTAKNYVYGEIIAGGKCHPRDDPFIPGDDYAFLAETMCNRKIVEGGYHLAYYLTQIFRQIVIEDNEL